MASIPTIQVLEKADYTKQHIVPLPNALPLPPLAPSSVRIKTSIIALTINNFTYARLGNLIGWWNIHLLPNSIPSEFSDTAKFGRISGWGYADIIESTVEYLPVGHQLYGYIPIGTLPEDLEVKPTGAKNQIQVTNPHRQHAWNIYNRYKVIPSTAGISQDSLGWKALMSGLFETGLTMNRYVLAWDDAQRLDAGGAKSPDWSAADADVSDAAVIALSASGKTAASFAYHLRHSRPKEAQPKALIGVSSPMSKEFTEGTGFYDSVLLYSDIEGAKAAVTAAKVSKVVLVDFAAREGALEAWHAALSPIVPKLVLLGVGGEARVMTPEEVMAMMGKRAALRIHQVNVSSIKDAAMEMGRQAYLDDVEAAWEEFKRQGAIPGVKLKWGYGMEDWAKAWDGLAKGEIGPDTGLLFRL